MANHKSALKRTRQNEKRRMRNKAVKTRVKKLVKDIRLISKETSLEKATGKINTVTSIIDRAAKKGVIHKKTAARKISRLSRYVNTVVA